MSDDADRVRSVVVALDGFKGSAGAAEASAAVAAGWRDARPGDDVRVRPMADGGEGTLAVFAAALPHARSVPVTVRGPHGREVVAHWLLLPDDGEGTTGVVELAGTSGIELLGGELRPWHADTAGFGQAIVAALDHGVDRLVLGIGSSASTDGGVGVLSALGGRFTDATGRPIAPGAAGLRALAAVDLSGVRSPPPRGVVVLSDVTSPLRGPRGAAARFGPQKGLRGADVALADAALGRLAALLPADERAPGAGAAGGTGLALLSWGGALVSGAARVAELIGLPAVLPGADLVITGEGAYDAQSAAGKAPGHVADLARAAGVPAALVAGRVAADADTSDFVATLSLTELSGSADAAVADPLRWLCAAGAMLAAATVPPS